MVRIHPDPPSGRRSLPVRAASTVGHGGVAQLGERLLCKQEVIGSIPFTSTIARCPSSNRNMSYPPRVQASALR